MRTASDPANPAPMPAPVERLVFIEAFAGHDIVLQATPMGRDLSVALSGGSLPHIGAVAVAQPRPSLADPARCSATTSVIALVGHKEDLLAHRLAGRIAAATGAVVALSCGIHYDNLAKTDIAEIDRITDRLVDRLLAAISRPPQISANQRDQEP